MMRSSALVISVISGLLVGVHPNSFHREIVSEVAKKERQRFPLKSKHNQQNVRGELLSKAIPIEEYNRQLRDLGVEPPVSKEERTLEEDNNYADDYFKNDQYMYSFSGYSMKYARCQPIQQFSEDALAAGEYSPMVTQDVIILRLCPYKSCSSSRQYGCHYNYAEYAIGLFDYIRIMLKNKEERLERTCEWCAACLGDERRKLDEDAQDQEEENGDNANGDDGKQNNNGNGGDDYYNADDDNANNNNDNANGDDYSQYYDKDDECYVYSSYCDNYYYDCAEDGGNNDNGNYDDYYYNQQQQGNYLDLEDYYDFLGCTELADNYGALYFVRPTCDSSTNEISMAPFYDEYCSQSASSVANMANFQVTFDDELFEDLYSGECMDCSESNYPPAFNTNSYMCNKIHFAGAGCTSYMVYDLFDGQSSDSTECSFIESIRFGTYDSNGEIAVKASDDAEEVVTDLQKLGLVGSAFICAIFVVYACYLHHSMTNLLIKSLSHRELLPPSRHTRRRSPNQGKRGRRSRSKGSKSSRRGDDDDDDEWDRSKSLRSPV